MYLRTLLRLKPPPPRLRASLKASLTYPEHRMLRCSICSRSVTYTSTLPPSKNWRLAYNAQAVSKQSDQRLRTALATKGIEFYLIVRLLVSPKTQLRWLFLRP
jgi:hypothetical protein